MRDQAADTAPQFTLPINRNKTGPGLLEGRVLHILEGRQPQMPGDGIARTGKKRARFPVSL